MSFDKSRFNFNPLKDYSGVVMQQGRVQLDSDWNEWLAEVMRRTQAGTLDTVGRAVYPATTPFAFHITASSSGGTNVLKVGPGRLYVDGLLAENHGDPATVQWDSALAEMSNTPQPPPGTETGAIDFTHVTSPNTVTINISPLADFEPASFVVANGFTAPISLPNDLQYSAGQLYTHCDSIRGQFAHRWRDGDGGDRRSNGD